MTITTVKSVVSETYDVPIAQLEAKRRGPEHICWPRQIAMCLCYEELTYSLDAIGQAFGGRDHGTVIHARHRVHARLDTEPAFRNAYTYLKQQIKATPPSSSLDSSQL